jgi:hypothetical protein
VTTALLEGEWVGTKAHLSVSGIISLD